MATTVQAMKNLGYAFGYDLESETVGDLIEELAEAIGGEANEDVKPIEGDILGKTYADFVDGTLEITKIGEVKGTLKHVTGFTEFNPAVPEEHEGYYLPFTFTDTVTGTTMTFVKNGEETKKDILFDKDILFRVSKGDEWKVLVDGVFKLRLVIGDEVTFEG